ncbi:MAG: ribonuclease H-like domain-containing protein [Clostridia bacterium]|nr:ribonuclease H-like domain-containing protein [Clostridia bacterium]
MLDDVLKSLQAQGGSLGRAVIKSLSVDMAQRAVTVHIITDTAFTPADEARAKTALRAYVPAYFDVRTEMEKLSPDEKMVARKIAEVISDASKAVSATMSDGDISVSRTSGGFSYIVRVLAMFKSQTDELEKAVTGTLKKSFCGTFEGRFEISNKSVEDLEVKREVYEPKYTIPVRRFKIRNFSSIDSSVPVEYAVYMSDMGNAAGTFSVCGVIQDVQERTYTNKRGVEKPYYSFRLSDTTNQMYVTVFPRVRNLNAIQSLKTGDSIVITGAYEEDRNGITRFNSSAIDKGMMPLDFKPEERVSRPVPVAYHYVEPRPFQDFEQHDFFTDHSVPQCLKDNEFVVVDIETTGLNAIPVGGRMDAILEIGAYKVRGGEICESFTTFVNPERKISEEITKLTGITEEMVADAPVSSQVMPDLYKFMYGCIIVGHNIVNFDFNFLEHYCAEEGYILERSRMIDTVDLAHELIRGLSNYKLNTLADYYGITFNHHRAIDDALVTAKIFIRLIKQKGSLPALS